ADGAQPAARRGQPGRLRGGGPGRGPDVQRAARRPSRAGRAEPGDRARRATAAAGPPRTQRGVGVRRPGRRRGADRVARRAGPARTMTAPTRLAIIVGVLATGLVGWAVGGYPGAALGLALAVAAGVIRWWGQ